MKSRMSDVTVAAIRDRASLVRCESERFTMNGYRNCSSRPLGDFPVQSDGATVEMHCKMTVES